MEKIDEISLRSGLMIKSYKTEGINTVLELIEKVKNSMSISHIEIKEDVEMDMQSFNGLTYTIDEFVNDYPRIKRNGKEVSYNIVGSFNGAKVKISIADGNNIITMITDASNLELDNIIPEIKAETLSL